MTRTTGMRRVKSQRGAVKRGAMRRKRNPLKRGAMRRKRNPLKRGAVRRQQRNPLNLYL